METSLSQLCGQLIIGGFDGAEAGDEVLGALRRGRLGGAILFRRNIREVAQVAALNRALCAACPSALPPLIAVDQEGGRVARLPAPVMQLPPMRAVGTRGDVALSRALAERLGRELAALGFNLDMAPVMDVDSNPQNPIIGDRAFGADVRTVVQHGVAFLQGLQAGGVLACAKHFPGHGDTDVDSHLDLPVVGRSRAELDALELPPFWAAAGGGVAALMTAHVCYSALDPERPATLSPAIATELLRDTMGFDGALVSDDLRMAAVADRPVGEVAVEAVGAGCDLLLVCSDAARQAAAHEALVEQAERDGAFAARCRQAAARATALRRRMPARPQGAAALGRLWADGEAAVLLARLRAQRGVDRPNGKRE